MAKHYASADVFLFPSETATFGNVTLEAMASGLVVVTYNYAAARMPITHGERIGKTNALFKPRADTGQPMMSAVWRVPRAIRALYQHSRHEVQSSYKLLLNMAFMRLFFTSERE